MQLTVLEQEAFFVYVQEEWRKFNKWATESRSTSPFGELALHWHAGHLTIEEGKRIEAGELLTRFLKRI
jgi:hypothetical protein